MKQETSPVTIYSVFACIFHAFLKLLWLTIVQSRVLWRNLEKEILAKYLMSLQRILLMTSNICYFIFGNSDCKFKPFTAHDCTMPDHLALFTSNHMPWTFEAVNRPKLETSRNQIILIFLLYPNKRNHMRNKYFGRTKTHPSQLFYSKQKDAVTEEYITLYSKQLVGSREQSWEGQLG